MDRSSALSKIATLTPGVKPTVTTTAADLNAARTALRSSLLAHAVDPSTANDGTAHGFKGELAGNVSRPYVVSG